MSWQPQLPILLITVSKRMCGISLIFCCLSFINNFMTKNSFSEQKNQRKLNISRPIYFEKISADCFVGLTCTNKQEGFFFEKRHFLRTWRFFYDYSATNLGVICFNKKIILYFFQGWLFNLIIIQKTCFKNLFRKTLKKWWFYSSK